jgi:hypothetical protein
MVDENSGLARVHRTKPSGTAKPILGRSETSVKPGWCDVLQKYLPISWHAGRCRRRPCPRSYCGGVDATPSRGRLTHMEHSLYEPGSGGQRRSPSFLLLLLPGHPMSTESGLDFAYYRWGARRSIFLPKACCCYSLTTNQSRSQYYSKSVIIPNSHA